MPGRRPKPLTGEPLVGDACGVDDALPVVDSQLSPAGVGIIRLT
jgi:hypothetical protein